MMTETFVVKLEVVVAAQSYSDAVAGITHRIQTSDTAVYDGDPRGFSLDGINDIYAKKQGRMRRG